MPVIIEPQSGLSHMVGTSVSLRIRTGDLNVEHERKFTKASDGTVVNSAKFTPTTSPADAPAVTIPSDAPHETKYQVTVSVPGKVVEVVTDGSGDPIYIRHPHTIDLYARRS